MAASIPPLTRKRRRWPRVLFVLFVLVAVALWFAPAIVSNTGLKDSLIAAATKDVKGTVRVESLSLGWLSPVELLGLTVADESGSEFVRVERVASSKSLIALAASPANLGRFTVESPTLSVVLTKDSSNLELAFAKYLEPSDSPSPARPAVAVTIKDGTVTITDAVTKRVRTVVGLVAELTVPTGATEAIAIAVTASIPDKSSAGSLNAKGTVGEGGELTAEISNVPLDLAGWVARRAEPGLTLAGFANGTVALRTSGDTVNVSGTAHSTHVVAANDLAGDVFMSPEVDVACDLGIRGSVFTSRKMLVTSPAGTLSWVGSLDASKPPSDWLNTAGLEFNATADVAKLPALLPGLRIAFDGTDVTSGSIDLRVSSATSPNGTTWAGTVNVSTLKALRGGVPVVWKDPVRGEFAARIANDGLPTFDKLQLVSDFIGLNARGSWDRFEAAANVDLDRLSAHLNEFIDLGGAALAGRATVTAWNRPGENGTMALALKANVERFAFSDGLAFSWQEPQLVMDASVVGVRDSGGAIRLDRGTGTLTAGGDAAGIELTRPIPDARSATAGALRATVSGDLARWRTRLASLVALPAEWHLAGSVNGAAAVTFTETGATAEDLTVNLTDVRFRGAGTVVNDPRVAATLRSATWDRKTGAVAIRSGQFGSAVAAGECPSLAIMPGPNGLPNVDGTITVTAARLNALAPIFGLATDPRGSDAVDGMAKGTLRFHSPDGKTSFDTTLAVEQFRFGPPAAPTWTEPKIALSATGTYDPAEDTLSLTTSRVAVDGLTTTAKGTVGKLTTTQQLDLAGTLDYDLARVEPKVREYLGKGGAISGKDSRPFHVTGSLANGPENLSVKVGAADAMFARLNGDASVGWQSVRAYGFDVGAADLKGTMDKGVVAFEPIRTSFGGGRVDVKPALDIRGGATDLTFAKGRIVDRARLTPAACANALGFALPAIANATDAEGFVSFDWDDGRIPLVDYTKMNAKGRLLVHSVRVVPGPVMRELLAVAGVSESSFGLAQEQTVTVRVENGRVYHSKFSLGAKNYSVTTSGSVGFDGSLQLTCEIPIPARAIDQALKNYPRVKDAMTKRSIAVTLGGTVTNPTLDTRAFQANLQKMFADATKDAVGGLLQQEIGKGLDRLFKPPPPRKP